MTAQGAALGLWFDQYQNPQRGGPNRAAVTCSVLKPPRRAAPLGLLRSVAFPTQGCALGYHRAAPLGLNPDAKEYGEAKCTPLAPRGDSGRRRIEQADLSRSERSTEEAKRNESIETMFCKGSARARGDAGNAG